MSDYSIIPSDGTAVQIRTAITLGLDTQGDVSSSSSSSTSDPNIALIATAAGSPNDAAYTTGPGDAISLLKGIIAKLSGTLTVSGGSGSNPSVSSTGAAVPASASAIGFQNASGNLVLPTPSAGLPVADSGTAITGASMPSGGVGNTGWLSAIWSSVATAANQTTANSTLASILTKATAIAASLAGTLTTALANGSNVIGYAGSLNTQVVVTPTITTSYASGACVGGLQTLSNFFRNVAQPSATLSQFFIGWTGAETANLTAFIFSKAPGISPTDGVALSFTAADLRNLVTAPITTSLAVPAAGSTKNFSATTLSLSVKNLESTLNLYVVLVADTAFSSANGELFFSISGVLD